MASAAMAAGDRWAVSYDQGTFEASISNRNDSSFMIYCPQGQQDTTAGMFIQVKRIKPQHEPVTVQIIVDGDSHAFDLNEIEFEASSRTDKQQFRALVDALVASKRKSFVVAFPQYQTSETFSLSDARKSIGVGKDSILEGCGASDW